MSSQNNIRRNKNSPLSTMDTLEARMLFSAAVGSALAERANELPAGQVEIEWRGEKALAWEGRYIVQMNNLTGRTAEQRRLAQNMFTAARSDAKVTRHLGKRGLLAVQGSAKSPAELLKQLAGVPGVKRIEPDFVLTASVMSTDPSMGSTWGLHNTGQTGGTPDADIDAPEAWDRTTGSSGVVVGIIDTGIDYTHPDLAANIWTNPGEVPGDGLDNDGNGYVDDVHGWDFYDDDGDPMDENGHGTHVAGTIGAVGNDGIGVTGVNWDVSMMALRFLGPDGGGSLSDALDAVNYATMMARDYGVNIRLTSNSWGGGGFSQLLQDAIAASGQQNMLFIAAAGNSGSNNDSLPHYPSSYSLSNVISVAATDHNDQLADFSCFGANAVHLGAPGVNVVSTVPYGIGYDSYSGTSMATPHVSGVAALAWAIKPNATAAEVRSALLAGADPIESLQDITVTGGRLNAARTLDLIQPRTNIISGRAFIDRDCDGIRDLNEVGAPGRTVYLDANNNGALDTGESSAITTAGGYYEFVDLAPGPYHVRQLLNSPWRETTPADGVVALVAGGAATIDPGSRLPLTGFSGQLFNDLNANGVRDAGESGLAGSLLMDQNGNGQLDQTVVNHASAEAPVSFGPASAVSHLTITDLATPIRDLDVTFNITHTYDWDVELYLVSPAGTRVRLVSKVGGSGANFGNTTLDDEAPIALNAASAPFTGRFRPVEPLSAFDGEDARGTWTLELNDIYPEVDNGTLNSWSMSISVGERMLTSAGDGTFAVKDLEPGNYHILPAIPTGWGLVSHAKPLDLRIEDDQVITGVDFGLRQNRIRLVTFEDLNGNGLRDGEGAIPDRTVYLDANRNGIFDGGMRIFSSTHAPMAILDAGETNSTIQVTTLPGLITDVDVIINITHTWDEDLTLILTAPTGQSVVLLSEVGGSGDNFTGTILDDEASGAISSGAAPFAGRFHPQQSLSTFDGLDGAGTWTLHAIDAVEADEGQILDWSLSFDTGEASFQTDATGVLDVIGIAPGTYPFAQVVPEGWHDLAGVRELVLTPGGQFNELLGSSDLPGVVESRFLYNNVTPQIELLFSEPVSAPLIADLEIRNISTNHLVAPTAVAGDGTKRLLISLPTEMEYGQYELVLPDGSVADLSGKESLAQRFSQASDGRYDFFVLPGDANRDRCIDIDDYFLVDCGYALRRQGFANGDFNYDGVIDGDDYFQIDKAYLAGARVSVPPTYGDANASPAQVAWPFADTVVDQKRMTQNSDLFEAAVDLLPNR